MASAFQHGVMLLTSADQEVFIPPRWHGTIYSTEDILDGYRKRFKVFLSTIQCIFGSIGFLAYFILLARLHAADIPCHGTV